VPEIEKNAEERLVGSLSGNTIGVDPKTAPFIFDTPYRGIMSESGWEKRWVFVIIPLGADATKVDGRPGRIKVSRLQPMPVSRR